MNSLSDFVYLVNSKVGSGYIWGGQSDVPLTQEKLQWFTNTFGREYYYFSGYSAERWLGKEYYDCSGLIVYSLIRLGFLSKGVDYTASDIYNKICKPINKAELKPGDLCFSRNGSDINHVGVYMGEDRVVHARSTFYGVVNTPLFDSFNLFGRLWVFVNDTSQIGIKNINSKKTVTASSLNIRELPLTNSQMLGQLNQGTVIQVSGVTTNNWYTFDYKGKTAYVSGTYLMDYDELKAALDFICAKSGISFDHWYQKAKEVEWLDACFIKIAKGFGM
jgi:cell wall-associated NlpC family hydrolase